MMMIMNDNNNNNDNNNDDNHNNNNDNSNNNDDASGCFFTNVTVTAGAEISIRGDLFFKSYHKFIEFNLFFIHPILLWIDELIHLYSIYLSSMNIEFHLWYENYRRHFQIYLQWRRLNFDCNFTEVCSLGSNWLYVSTGSGNGLAPNRRETITRINADQIHRRIYTALGGNKITKSGRSFHWGLVHLVQSTSLCWNSPKIFHTLFETLPVGAKSLPILPPDYWHPPQSNFTEYKQDMVAVFYAPVNGQWVN